MGITSSNGLERMDCSAEGTAVKIWSVGDNPVTYRIGFGNRVLDIPNESSAAGVVASTYGWNGGAHQRYIMEQAAEGDAFYLQNYKSKLYLLASGKNVVQDQRNRNVESGAWILLENAAAVPAEKDSAETVPPDTSETPSVADSSERNPEAGADGIQNGAVRRGVGKNGGVVPRERFDVLGRSLKRGGKVSKYLKLFRGEVR